jgi:hypothetical protein
MPRNLGVGTVEAGETMPDYTAEPSPAEIAEAQNYIATSVLTDSAVWRSVSYTPDGRGGVTRSFTDTTIPVFARNPVDKPTSPTKAPGESVHEFEFICRVTDDIQPKDVIRYSGLDLEVVEVLQKGTASFAHLVYGKRVGS